MTEKRSNELVAQPIFTEDELLVIEQALCYLGYTVAITAANPDKAIARKLEAKLAERRRKNYSIKAQTED